MIQANSYLSLSSLSFFLQTLNHFHLHSFKFFSNLLKIQTGTAKIKLPLILHNVLPLCINGSDCLFLPWHLTELLVDGEYFGLQGQFMTL